MGNFQGTVKEIDYSIRAPYDEKDPRFVKSFQLSDSLEEISQFYESYGFVVFDNILNEVEIDQSIQDLWAVYDGASPDDPSTWRKVRHPFGFAGEEPIGGLQLWNNRQHPNVYQSFKLTYEAATKKKLTEPLVACLDRGNIMLPTSGPNGKTEYETARCLHFDLNPYIWCQVAKQIKDEDDMYYKLMYDRYFLLLSEGNNTLSHGYPKLRAVLQISESTEDRGGLELLSGFHNQIKLWCKLNPPKDASFRSNSYGYGVAAGDPIEKNLQKITVRKGSIIIFSSELPHTMFPNESDQFRYAQYLRMAPLSTLELSEEQKKKRETLIRQNVPPDLTITDLGKEVFLLSS